MSERLQKKSTGEEKINMSDGVGDLSSIAHTATGEDVERNPSSMQSDAELASSSSRKTETQDAGNDERKMPAYKRLRTEPMQPRRPSLKERPSTFLGLKRSRTGPQSRPNRSNTFTYQFKDAPLSDSEDSSSSSEDEGEKDAVDREDHVPPPQQANRASTTEMEGENKKTKKRHAYSRFKLGNDLFNTKGRVSRKDGRLNISINSTANGGYGAKAFGQSISNHLAGPGRNTSNKDKGQHHKKRSLPGQTDPSKASLAIPALRPRLNIVIMVIGSRGDIQPFLKIGKILRHDYGHRVRIASHPVFRDFVEKDVGLEFFSVGGDPSELMAFMVKNPGLIPNMSTLREGEIGRRRNAMAEMFEGMWRSCINTTENEHDKANLKMMENLDPFVADAIIANPPSMAHVHIAEKLGIPLHIMFTFPYTPTAQFPHPLANIKPKKSNVDASYVNFMSYSLVEMMTWQGLGDIVNKFRENTLRLEPVSSLWAPGALYRMKVPYTYMWSPSLVPKPQDWGPEVDIAGFVFLDLASNFKPPKELTDFLDAGEPPIYIGFGSIVVDDSDRFTQMIFEAVEAAGVRALVNKGWGGLGHSNKDVPKNIFMLDNTPHDWLFPKVSAVVHHGGAGTTAIGLKCARPTMIVPFFGDQPFWGAMVAEARAGAFECIPYKKLNAERLAKGIKQCLTDEAKKNVQKIADSIEKEGDGAENAVKSFHRSLPLVGRHSMRCSILQDRVAVWRVRLSSLRLSALAAQILHKQGKIKWADLKLHRVYHWNDFDGPGEPITGTVGALTDSLYGIGEGVGMVPIRISRHIQHREEHKKRKRERQKRKEERARQQAQKASNEQEEAGNEAAEEEEKSTGDETAGVDAAATEHNDRPPTKRELTNDTLASKISADPEDTLPEEVVDDVNWGLKRAGLAALTMPEDVGYAIAQGLHNAPRLWGDATVRKPTKITGFKSGWTAARRELVYGVYDGWSGLIKQPKGDWKDADTLPAKIAGLGTGLGKGVGGLVLKNVNAVVAPPAFMVKGFMKYIENKHEGPGSKAFIRRSHIVQGERDYWALQRSDDPQKLRDIEAAVEYGWKVYEEIWAEAHREFGPGIGGNFVGKYRLKREQRAWDVNGALENVNTAEHALHLTREGGHRRLMQYLEERSEVVKEAELPRAPAMEGADGLVAGALQNGVRTETELPNGLKKEVTPNGVTVQGSLPSREKQDEQQALGVEAPNETEFAGAKDSAEAQDEQGAAVLPNGLSMQSSLPSREKQDEQQGLDVQPLGKASNDTNGTASTEDGAQGKKSSITPNTSPAAQSV